MDGGFEFGVRTALEGILASPHFTFRFEEPAEPGSSEAYRLADADLASRLPFFLWATAPDAELTKLAAAYENSGDDDLAKSTRQEVRQSYPKFNMDEVEIPLVRARRFIPEEERVVEEDEDEDEDEVKEALKVNEGEEKEDAGEEVKKTREEEASEDGEEEEVVIKARKIE